MTIEVVTEPADGTTEIVVDEGEPSIEFTPAAGFDGVTTFTYEACVDGSCDSAEVRVFVGVSACTIVGTNGRNTLTGTDGDDVICGRRGADTIDAGAGDDIVFGGRGADTIVGGAGDDVLRGGRGNDTITGGVGDDELHGARGTDILDGGEGADLIFGGKGPDTITGGAGDDVLIGKAGDDVISGNDGDDVLRGWRGNDILDGGDGNDVLHGGRHADELVGGPGDDDLRGKLGADVINAGPGNDVIYGGRGADVAHGGDGDDQVRGNRGNDTLDGGNGTDTLNGGNGNDSCDDAETAVKCETETSNGEGETDTVGPTAVVEVVDDLAGVGELHLGLTAQDVSGIESVLLVSPDGYSYEVAQVDEQNWAAVVNADRLFAGDSYGFVFVVTDTAGNATVTEEVLVEVPDDGRPVPAVSMAFESGVPLSGVLAQLAATGLEPFEFTHTRMVDDVGDLSPDLRELVAAAPEEAHNYVGREYVGVANVNGTPLAHILGLYEGLYAAQGGSGEPLVTAVRAFAPSAAASTTFEQALAANEGAFAEEEAEPAEARSLDYIPGGDDGWRTEPFWPTEAQLWWSDAPAISIYPTAYCYTNEHTAIDCGVRDLFGDIRVEFEARNLMGAVSGLSTYFRPYFNEYGTGENARSYEFDVAQINLGLETGSDHQWFRHYPARIQEALDYLTGPTCDVAGGDMFPIARQGIERIASHDYARIESDHNGYRFSLFETNVNQEAGPYPDTFAGDGCAEMDLSFGIANPNAVDQDLSTLHYSFTAAKGALDQAGLSIEHQSLDRHPENLTKSGLCSLWSGEPYAHGTNFCVGVLTELTRGVTMLANTDSPTGVGFEPATSVPWMEMEFPGNIAQTVCFEMVVPPSRSATAPYLENPDHGLDEASERPVHFGLQWGLANVAEDCFALRPGDDPVDAGFKIESSVLPMLEASQPYWTRLGMVDGEDVAWSVLEDPILRYTDRSIYYQGGLPEGLALNPVTGEISGTPEVSTLSGGRFVTVQARRGDQVAVAQLMFEQPTDNIVGSVSTQPDPVEPDRESVMLFEVTNQGSETVSAAGLVVRSQFVFFDPVYSGGVCGVFPDDPFAHRCDVGSLAPGETKFVEIRATIDLPPVWRGQPWWGSTPGSSTVYFDLVYDLNV